MIEVIYDGHGNIKAVCEWLLFNKLGKIDDEGHLLFIGDMEIVQAYRGNGVVKEFIRRLLDKVPQATRCFFYRKKKYPGRDYRVYDRTKWTRRM